MKEFHFKLQEVHVNNLDITDPLIQLHNLQPSRHYSDEVKYFGIYNPPIVNIKNGTMFVKTGVEEVMAMRNNTVHSMNVLIVNNATEQDVIRLFFNRTFYYEKSPQAKADMIVHLLELSEQKEGAFINDVEGENTKDRVATILNISRATVYNYLELMGNRKVFDEYVNGKISYREAKGELSILNRLPKGKNTATEGGKKTRRYNKKNYELSFSPLELPNGSVKIVADRKPANIQASAQAAEGVSGGRVTFATPRINDYALNIEGVGKIEFDGTKCVLEGKDVPGVINSVQRTTSAVKVSIVIPFEIKVKSATPHISKPPQKSSGKSKKSNIRQ